MYKPLVWSLFHFPFICAMVNLHGRNGAMSSHRKAAYCESPSDHDEHGALPNPLVNPLVDPFPIPNAIVISINWMVNAM